MHHWKRESNKGLNVGIGLLSAAAAAGLTYYLFGTDDGTEKREKAKEWMKSAKDRATGAIGTLGELGQVGKEMSKDVAALVKDRYEDLKEMNKEEISDLANRVRAHWAEARSEIETIVDEAGDAS